MKICAVKHCGNSTYHLEKWRGNYCDIHGTHFGERPCDCPPPFILFPFPTEKRNSEGRKRWNKLVNRQDEKGRNWQNKPYDRICSKHFPDGKPSVSYPDPVLHMGYEVRRKDSSKTAPKRPPPKERLPVKRFKPELDLPPSGCVTKQSEINSLRHRVNTLEEKLISAKLNSASTSNPAGESKSEVKPKRQTLFSAKSLVNDSEVSHCTGFRSKEAFDDFFTYIEPFAKEMQYWKGTGNTPKKTATPRKYKQTPTKAGPKRKLGLKDELLMVLMRLRLDHTITYLAILFGVGSGTCSQIINTWLRFLSTILRGFILWPSRATITKHMPDQFKKSCKNLRCIIDCTEIFIERPRSLDLQAETWSDYKKHNTLKVLVGITPNGQFSFVSRSYGGRASDVHIVRESGFLDLIEPYDTIMADRGFPIQEDLMLRFSSLEIPPAAKGNRQMTRSNVKQTKKVANLRIHVERAINRLKDFKILSGTLPISLIPQADDIITICAALTNLLPDLIS
ncbi:Protein ALP1-like [Holothuria leucospilota]|uniref:Protein ALP1-like n=1 Tax=Holothuria leucospilota TaxID=206669 RepID=A0A9Q1BQW9_HOLLE|nr:Protein ALP1-like [Holothuria leucospilota]